MGTQILGVYSTIIDMTVQINIFSALAVQPIISSLTASRIQEEQETSKIREQVKYSLTINITVALAFGAVLIALFQIDQTALAVILFVYSGCMVVQL